MKIRTEVTVHEIDGEEKFSGQTIAVEDDWKTPQRVVVVTDGKRYLVNADELRRAIVNATNHS